MKKNTLCLLLIFNLFFSACKKGEDDPFMSLRSRKARLAGEWSLSDAKITIDFFNSTASEHFDGVYTLKGSKLVGTETTLTTIASVSGTYILCITIDKEGKFFIKETMNSDVLKGEGTWDFNTGTGDDKKKEVVQFKISSLSSGNTGSHFFNQWSTEFSYHIKELRNKTIVLTSVSPRYINKKGETDTFNAEYTFTQ